MNEKEIENSFINDEKQRKKKIRKTRIAISLFALLLAVGVTGNWYLENSDFSSKVSPISAAKEKILGQAQFVDATTEESPKEESEYFASSRLERQNARDEAIEKLNAVVESTEDENAKKEASEKLTRMSELIAIENKIETLVMAKGINNCLAVTNEDGSKADIIVTSGQLNDSVILQIKEIVVSQLGCSYENVTIIEAN